MSRFAQAITNGTGDRLMYGLDLSNIKAEPITKRVDVWDWQSSPYLERQRWVLGDLLGPDGKFDQLARFAASEGHNLREPVLMRKGVSHKRLQVGGKEYLQQSYRFYEQDKPAPIGRERYKW